MASFVPIGDKIMWWGYRHSNNSIQLKRWHGDVEDYTKDCEGNSFVRQIVPPFEAPTAEAARQVLQDKLAFQQGE